MTEDVSWNPDVGKRKPIKERKQTYQAMLHESDTEGGAEAPRGNREGEVGTK